MSTIKGSVVSVALNKEIRGQNKTYTGWQLIIEQNGEIKTIAKHMASLKFAPTIRTALEDLKAGDFVTIVQEKNDQGFLDVKSITKGDTNEDIPQMTKPNSSSSYTNKGRDFESAEERKIKQELIVRQSAIGYAINTLNTAAKAPPKPADVLELAQVYRDWVYGENASEEGFRQPNDDIPL